MTAAYRRSNQGQCGYLIAYLARFSLVLWPFDCDLLEPRTLLE